MTRTLTLTSLVALLFLQPAFAADQGIDEVRSAIGHSALPFLELTDAPTIAVDWSKGHVQAVTLHGNRTLVFANGQKGGTYRLIIKQDATGSRIVRWPPTMHWPGENQLPPVLTTTANRKDYLTFFYDGVTYDALALAQNY